MSPSARSDFLARVAAAVRAGTRHREPHAGDREPAVCVDRSADPVRQLIDELRAVGVRSERISSIDAVQAALRTVWERHAIRRVLIGSSPLLERLEIPALLRRAGLDVAGPAELSALDEESRRECIFAAELGVAVPEWAIAESGTLVYACGPGQPRSVTLLPPVHLAIVDASRVLHDLLDLPDRLSGPEPAQLPSRSIVLVTGPSKTGDIALRLTTGVHGPGEVHALVWDVP